MAIREGAVFGPKNNDPDANLNIFGWINVLVERDEK